MRTKELSVELSNCHTLHGKNRIFTRYMVEEEGLRYFITPREVNLRLLKLKDLGIEKCQLLLGP